LYLPLSKTNRVCSSESPTSSGRAVLTSKASLWVRLIKIKAVDPTTRSEIVNYATIFRGNILDIGKETITVEITGTPDKIDAFKNLVEYYGIAQLSRTGVSALPRGGVES
jgi:acetolactate synthase small subunit